MIEHTREEVVLINMKDVQVEEVKWLCYPLIPCNKVTILQGNPGEGKTTVMLQIIARLTRGEPIINCEDVIVDNCFKEPVNVIYQTAEDGLGDTIKPRLIEAGADCSKVLVIDDSERGLSIRDERLEEAIFATDAKLVVLDPIQAFLGAGVDMHRANEIRPLMKRLAVLADKYECAIVLIGHMNKNIVTSANYRGLGSIDFIAAARSVIVCGRLKDEPEKRVLCQTKSSLAPEGEPIAFKLDKESGFRWVGKINITADDLLSGSSTESKLNEAIDFLKAFLSDGSKPATEIFDEASKRNIKEKTLRNAKSEIDALAVKENNRWYWQLP